MRERTKKQCLSWVLTFLLVISGMFSSIQAKADSGESLIDDWTIQKDGADLCDDDIVYKDDTLDIRYSLVELIPGDNIEQGVTYEFSLPSNISIASNTNWDATVDDNVLCNCHYNKNTKKIEVTFVDDIFTNPMYASGITDAFIGFFASVDSTGKSAGDSCTISGPEGTGIDIDIYYGGDTPTADASVNKVGAISDEDKHLINWTVTVTEGANPVPVLYIKDVISDAQAFVEDSFEVDGIADTPSINGLELNYELEVTDPFPNRKHVITYQTVVYPVQQDGNDYVTKEQDKVTVDATNKVTVHASQDGTALDTANANVSGEFGKLQWMEKKFVSIEAVPGETDSRVVTWEVKVHTNGYTVINAVIRDKVEAGEVEGSTLSFVKGSFEMVEDGTSDNIASVNGSPSFVNGVCEWETNTIQSLCGDYTITYQVKISNYNNYKYNNEKKIENTAWATYDWIVYGGAPGFGPGYFPGITVDAGDVATKQASLSKKVPKVNYNYDVSQRGAEVHGMPWIITVNEDKEVLDSSVYLVETIGGENTSSTKVAQIVKGETAAVKEDLIFDVEVDGQKATADEYAQISIDASDAEHVKIFFGNLLSSGKKVSFRFQTYMPDSEKDFYEGQNWTDNSKGRVAYNTAALYDGDTELIKKNATMWIFTNVLRKLFNGYDYSDQTIKWRFEINRDMMLLKDAKITDVLSAGSLDRIELVKHQQDSHDEAAGTKFTLSETPNEDGIYYTYDDTTKKVVVNFGDIPISRTYTMYIYEKVDPEREINDDGVMKSFANYNGDIKVTNEATLSKEGSSDVNVKAEGTIRNQLFDKAGVISAKGKATYTIKMNQGHKTWPAGSEISDIMSEGLSPDIDSFKLCVAEVASDGTMTAGLEVTESKYEVTVTTLPAGSSEGAAGSVKTVVSIPADAVDEAYILTYDVYVDENYAGQTDDLTFSNTVTVNGNPNEGTKASADISLSQLVGYGGGTISFSKVKMVKKNEDGETLAGAEFDLIYNGKVVQSAVTDENGEIVFSNLTPKITYTLKETKAPEGYELADAKEFVAPARGDSSLLDSPIQIVDKKIVPENPGDNPNDPGNDPENPGTTPDDPGTTPDDPGNVPIDPGTTPDDPGNTPDDPGTTPGNTPGNNAGDTPGNTPGGNTNTTPGQNKPPVVKPSTTTEQTTTTEQVNKDNITTEKNTPNDKMTPAEKKLLAKDRKNAKKALKKSVKVRTGDDSTTEEDSSKNNSSNTTTKRATKTGDESNPLGIWLLLMACLVSSGILVYTKKEKN